MKKTIASLIALAIVCGLHAQTNLLTDPGFETLQPGYTNFITPGSGKSKGMSGKWQMVMARGGCPTGCAKGSASVVSSNKKTDNNSVEIRIDSMYNRNDIRIFQSIINVPAGVYEISFYAKSSEPSPIAIDALRSSQASSNNGAAPYTAGFTTSTQWQQFKFTVDISDWSDDDRNEMRVSIRPNSHKGLPAGPYPKTFWIDDVSMVAK